MKLFYLLLCVLLFLLSIILLAGLIAPIPAATGIPHPEFSGMYIAPNNIDQVTHTRWLGYLFGLGILGLFTAMLFIGNLKAGKITTIGKWLGMAMIVYMIVFSFMVFSNWTYVNQVEHSFFDFMPIPTAWMIYAVWFAPLIITIAYITKFEEAIISDQEIEAFHKFLDQHRD